MLGGMERITPGCTTCQYSKGNAVTNIDVFRIVAKHGASERLVLQGYRGHLPMRARWLLPVD